MHSQIFSQEFRSAEILAYTGSTLGTLLSLDEATRDMAPQLDGNHLNEWKKKRQKYAR